MKEIRRCLILMILLLSAVLLLIPTTQAYTINGQVVDIEGTPLPGAAVELSNNITLLNETTTDQEGMFEFNDVDDGDYNITASYEGISNTTSIRVLNGSIFGLGAINISATFQIEVKYDSGGGGVPGEEEEEEQEEEEEEEEEEDDDIIDDDNRTDPTSASKITEDNSYICGSIALIGSIILIVGMIIAYQYSKITSKKLMAHETRQRILKHIDDQPGGHLRGIKGDLGLSMGVLTHHIGILEREEVIKSRDDGMYKRYYPYKFKIEGTTILTGSQKKMFKAIKEKPGSTPDMIAESIGKSRKTIYYHIQELEAKGIITTDKTNGSIKCFPMQDT